MPKIRLPLASQGLAAASVALVAVLGTALGASAQVVRTFDQDRSTSVRANAADRTNSVVGFGTFTSDLAAGSHVEPNVADGTATQTSGIYGDSTLARGEAHGQARGGSSVASAASDFSVHFLLATRTGFTLTGRVSAQATARLEAVGEASAMIQFTSGDSVIATAQRGCGVNSGQPQPCDEAEDLVASGVLEPGIYHLEAHASAEGIGVAEALGAGTGSFTLRIWFDGPVVGARPATWGDVKSLYRD